MGMNILDIYLHALTKARGGLRMLGVVLVRVFQTSSSPLAPGIKVMSTVVNACGTINTSYGMKMGMWMMMGVGLKENCMKKETYIQ